MPVTLSTWSVTSGACPVTDYSFQSVGLTDTGTPLSSGLEAVQLLTLGEEVAEDSREGAADDINLTTTIHAITVCCCLFPQFNSPMYIRHLRHGSLFLLFHNC